jgi:diguanylate cyclase (GGDEF)-like protein
MKKTPLSRLPRNPNRQALLLLILVLTGVIGVVDYATGTAVRFFTFYLLPIAMVAWYFGRRATVCAALVCGAVWFAANGSWFPSLGMIAWNTFVITLGFVVFGWLLALLKMDRDELSRMAAHDELTGLLNRRALVAALDAEVRRAVRFGEGLSVAFIDIDGFKRLNDTKGHKAGDGALRVVARTIARRIRASDEAGRFGGDEFVILFPRTSGPEAMLAIRAVVDRLNRAVEKRELDISFSVGLASYDKPPTDVTAIINEADALMYRAKSSGKGRIVAQRCGPEADATGPARRA